ncbi:MAG: lipase family protein [Candidatus Eremiobacteraeota bacterium]|nr:lipase family protein [Candidatus Eremiobacteraeota bacterium]
MVISNTKSYSYSEQVKRHKLEDIDYSTFDPKDKISRDNAVILSSAAAITYTSPEFQAEFFKNQAAVKKFEFLDSKNNAARGVCAPDTGTQVSLIETDDALIVASRGTPLELSDNPDTNLQTQDLINDLNAWPTKNYDGSALVHSGFKNAADGIWGQLKPHLEEAEAAGKSLHFVGHSLGAAISTHLCDRLFQEMHALPTSLVTIGGPAVGWGDELAHLESIGLAGRTTRFVNNIDPVVGAVPLGAQIGTQVYFGADGKAQVGDGWRVGDRLEGLKQAAIGFELNPLQDHYPVVYHDLIARPDNAEVLSGLEH